MAHQHEFDLKEAAKARQVVQDELPLMKSCIRDGLVRGQRLSKVYVDLMVALAKINVF